MLQPTIQYLTVENLNNAIAPLRRSGKLQISETGLVYLDVDDNYIHKVFPLIQTPQVYKADYFQPGAIGAHITVFYPDEEVVIDKADLEQEHYFVVTQMVTAKLGVKTYYILLVHSPSLIVLREKYGLSGQLAFRGYWVNLHITVGKLLPINE